MKLIIVLLAVVGCVLQKWVVFSKESDLSPGDPNERSERDYYGKYEDEARLNQERPYHGEDNNQDYYQINQPNYNPVCPYNCEKPDSIEYVQSLALTLYEYYNSQIQDHRYTTQYVGDVKDGYRFVKCVGGVFPIAQTDTVAVWFGYSSALNDSFYTTSLAELQGNTTYVNQGVVSYIYPSPYWYTVPIYRYFCNATADHQYTIDFNQFGASSNGCILELIVGYILPSMPNCRPYPVGMYSQNYGRY